MDPLAPQSLHVKENVKSCYLSTEDFTLLVLAALKTLNRFKEEDSVWAVEAAIRKQ